MADCLIWVSVAQCFLFFIPVYPRIRARCANVSLWLLGHNSNIWASIKNTLTRRCLTHTHTLAQPPPSPHPSAHYPLHPHHLSLPRLPSLLSNCICEYEQVGLYVEDQVQCSRKKRKTRKFEVCKWDSRVCATACPISFAPSAIAPQLPLWARRTFWYQPPNQKFVATNCISRIPRAVCVWVRKSASSKDGPLISNKFLLLSHTHTHTCCPCVPCPCQIVWREFEFRFRNSTSSKFLLLSPTLSVWDRFHGRQNHKHSNSELLAITKLFWPRAHKAEFLGLVRSHSKRKSYMKGRFLI